MCTVTNVTLWRPAASVEATCYMRVSGELFSRVACVCVTIHPFFNQFSFEAAISPGHLRLPSGVRRGRGRGLALTHATVHIQCTSLKAAMSVVVVDDLSNLSFGNYFVTTWSG